MYQFCTSAASAAQEMSDPLQHKPPSQDKYVVFLWHCAVRCSLSARINQSSWKTELMTSITKAPSNFFFPLRCPSWSHREGHSINTRVTITYISNLADKTVGLTWWPQGLSLGHLRNELKASPYLIATSPPHSHPCRAQRWWKLTHWLPSDF